MSADRSRQKVVVLVMASAMAVAVIAVTTPAPRAPQPRGALPAASGAPPSAAAPRPWELCGGSRREGRSLRTGGNDLCGLQESGDMSCDRWGCANLADERTGRAECSVGHLDFRTDAEPEYFLCFRTSYGAGGVGICGGGRRDGGDEELRWGCARVIDPATGRLACPEGSLAVKVGDEPAYLLCLGGNLAHRGYFACGGFRRDGADAGWGCVVPNSITGSPECRPGTQVAPVGEDPPTFLCLTEQP